MKYSYIDYDPIKHTLIDDWRSDEIFRFAINSNCFSDEWNYYVNCDEYSIGVDCFCKVVICNSVLIAVMIILCRDDSPVSINPIIVDPKRTGHGLGSDILRDFIANIGSLLPQHSDCIQVGICADNHRSIRAFSNAGLALTAVHPDGDYLFYRFVLP
jgi:RimJ/RimL family protein N-acetyltransferase